MEVSFNRVILFVQSVEMLKNFYRQYFHFELLEEIKEEWVVLKAGNCELALHKAVEVVSQDASNSGNNVKLVLETTASLHQLRAQLISNGVAMKEIKSFGSANYLFCDGADIEGNVFQIMQKVF